MFLYDDSVLPHYHYYLHGIVNLPELESSDKPNAFAGCGFSEKLMIHQNIYLLGIDINEMLLILP